MNKDYELFGFIQGDGDLGRLKSDAHKGIEINIGKKDYDVCEYLSIDVPRDRTVYYNKNNIKSILLELGFSSKTLPYRSLPKTFCAWSDDSKLKFMKGLYSANGCFIKVGRIGFKTTCNELANELKYFFESIGYHPYITTNKPKVVSFSNGEYLCKESYDVNLGRIAEIKRFYEEIGFMQKYKMQNIRDYLIKKGRLDENS